MADWVSPNVFGTKFVCKLMAASRSDGCKAAVMSPMGEVVSPMGEVMARRASSDVPAGGGCRTSRSDATCAMRTQPRQSRHNVSINEQKIYHE